MESQELCCQTSNFDVHIMYKLLLKYQQEDKHSILNHHYKGLCNSLSHLLHKHKSLENHQKQWLYISSILLHFTILEKLFLLLNQCSDYLSNFAVQCPQLLCTLLEFTKLGSPIVYYSSFKTFEVVLCTLKKHEHCQVVFHSQLTSAYQWIQELNLCGQIVDTINISCSFYAKVVKDVENEEELLKQPHLANMKWLSNMFSKVCESTSIQFLELCRIIYSIPGKSSHFHSYMLQLYNVLLGQLTNISYTTRPYCIALLKDLLPCQPCVEKGYEKVAHMLLGTVPRFLNAIKYEYSEGEVVKFHFGGYELQENCGCPLTASECIDLINGSLRASAIICCACPSDINTCISQDLHILSLLFPFPKMSTILSKMLDLFMEQDDGLMEFLLLHLQTFIKCVQFEPYLFDPHEAFISLQIKLSFDFSILLDWLMSNETDFLLYFVKYLKYLQTSPERFCDSCKIMGHAKHQVLNELSNLKLCIAKLHMKELFPYNPQPLIKNLENAIKLIHS
ncbi:uncharacterized protein LOC100181817 [Ciona intestinalis]